MSKDTPPPSFYHHLSPRFKWTFLRSPARRTLLLSRGVTWCVRVCVRPCRSKLIEKKTTLRNIWSNLRQITLKMSKYNPTHPPGFQQCVFSWVERAKAKNNTMRECASVVTWQINSASGDDYVIEHVQFSTNVEERRDWGGGMRLPNQSVCVCWKRRQVQD